jgi:hypothetical protein
LSVTSAELAGLAVILAVFVDRSCAASILQYVIKARFFYIITFLLGLYGALLSIIWGANELIFAFLFGKLFISSVIAYTIIYYLRKDLARMGVYNEREVILIFFDVFFVACFIQASTVILSFLYPEIRDVFNGIIVNRGNIDIDHAFRFRGLHDSGGSNLSVVLGIASFYGFYSAMILDRKGSVLRIIATIFVAFAITLVGRTGLMIFLFGLAILIIFQPLILFKIKSIILMLGVLIVGSLLNSVFPGNFELFNSSIFDYAFEIFVNYENSGSFTTGSSDDLKTMLFIPEGIHLLLGSGSFDGLNMGVDRSDSGYMKILLASGLFGFIIFYTQLSVIIFRIAQKIASTGIEWMLFVFLLTTFVTTEIKEPVFIQNDTSRFFLLMAMVIFTIKNMRTRINA